MGGTPRRVLYLAGFFPPDVIAKRAGGIAATLASRGHRVTVITRWPTHLDGRSYTAQELEAADRDLPGGVDVIRLQAQERRSAATWRRILSQLDFAARAALRAVRLASRNDVVLAYTPPPFIGPAAWLAAKLCRRPLVLEVQDLYPAQALALGVVRPGMITAAAAAVERLLYRGAERLVVVTEGYREHAVGVGADPSRIRVIPNSCDVDAFRPDVEPLPSPWDALVQEGAGPAGATSRLRFTAVFAGTVGLAQGSEVILDAAAALAHRPDIVCEVWGGGARYPALREGAAARGLGNVRFGPAVAHRDMPRVLARGDVLVLTLHPDPVFTRVLPSKLSEYLAMGRPVAAAASGEVARILERAGAGLAVAPLDGAGLAGAVARLADDAALRSAMGRRARALAEERFPHELVSGAFAAVVEEAAAAPD
ncbi:MAG TPA: glycosyltransferase family 4 protein [Longimicrobiales bacterium]|nr:glycosyltransferase family 4 protein [Longimicrobiales bacterium]